MKILLADDDPVSRRLLERALERSGFDVVCVADGESAAEQLLAPDGPRMAILDWVMPRKDGPAVCKLVRECVGIPYVYLILLTAKEAIGDIVLGFEAGADDYLTKPCNPDELQARMRAGQRVLQLQDSLLYEAEHDSLTKLPNRAFFVKRLATCVRKAREHAGYQFTLLFVDVDRFKSINDSLGHLVGDRLMESVAQRLLEAVRTETSPSSQTCHRRKNGWPGDVVARIGGDEFVILLDDFADIKDGMRVAERIQEVLRPAFHIDNNEVVITTSIGISTSTGQNTNSSEILRGADTAMYRAKILGKARYEVGDSQEAAAAADRFKLEADLRRAVERDEFEVHYQPIVELADSRIVAFEALVRWRHPELGMIQPGSFIPIAEETGLIVPIGELVMRKACRQTHSWNTHSPSLEPIGICVNISPRQFGEANLVNRIKTILDETGLEHRCLELELTENLTMQDVSRASQILAELRSLGLSLSLDDFGTGYSSLSYLLRFPIRTLKIDRSFISEIENSRESSQIVQTIIALGHNLGMKVVAEGIETEAQMQMLKTLQCDLGQGYLFSPAVDSSAATAILNVGISGTLPMRHSRRRAQPIPVIKTVAGSVASLH